MMLRVGLFLALLGGCDRSSGATSDASSASPSGSASTGASAGPGGGASATPSGSASTAMQPPPPADPRPVFELVFQVHDVEKTPKNDVRARLRLKAKDGQTLEYKTPISHADCYLVAGKDSTQSVKTIEGDEAHLVCSGGGMHDEATVKRTSDTSAEVTFSQTAFGAPDTPPASPQNVQKIPLKVPAGTRLMTTFEAPASAASKK